MVLLDELFCDIIFVKITLGIQIVLEFISEVGKDWYFALIHPLIWISNDLDAQNDFDKNSVTKKAGHVEPFLS